MRIPVEKKVDDLESWLHQLQKQVSGLKPDNEEVEGKLKSLQMALEKALVEQATQQRQQVNCQKQIALLRSQIESASEIEKTRALEEKVKELDAELGKLKMQTAAIEVAAQLKGLQEEFLSLKKSSEQVAKFNSSLRSQLQGVIAESERQVQQFASWQQEFAEQQLQQNKSQEVAITELQTQLSQTKIALTKRIAALEGRVKDLEVKHDSLVAKTDPAFTVAQKILKLRQAILKDEFIRDELKYYVAPNGESQVGSGDHLPLSEWVEENLLGVKTQVRALLLQGQAGAGKSTFNRFFLRYLWQAKAWEEFKPGDSAPQTYLPIFIPLGSQQVNPKSLLKYLTDLPELVEDFTEAEVNVLKRDYHVLLIADGYDEMPGNQALNLYDVNQLNQYEGRFKLLIGCRTQRVQQLDETDLFVPHDRIGKPQSAFFKRRHISPFSDHQIHDYLSKYLAQNRDRKDITLWDKAEVYEQHLSNLPDLKSLITTPFLLLMCIEVLPKIVQEVEAKDASVNKEKEHKESKVKERKESKESKVVSKQQFTRAKLYDVFMESWFARQADKARLAGETVSHSDLMKDYHQFCLKFAECLRGAGVTSVQYPFEEEDLFADAEKENRDPQGAKGLWVKKLLSNDNERMVRARKGAPLLISPNKYYQFIHASLAEYFLTTAIAEQAIRQKDVTPSSLTIKVPEQKTEVVTLPDAKSSSLEELLNRSLLSRDEIYLLADRVKQDSQLQAELMRLISRSKREEILAKASANAITVLNAAEVNFSGLDLSRIRIPGADLSGAICDSTQFKEADLTDVNFQAAWLRSTNFSRANLKGLHFGEGAYIKMKAAVMCCAYSVDGKWLAIASGNNIEIYEASTRIIKQSLNGHKNVVTSLTWDPQSERLASGSEDNTIQIWNALTGKELSCLKGHTKEVRFVDWDPQGRHLASADDYTIRIWETSKYRELHCYKVGCEPCDDYGNEVYGIAWDPSGERLARLMSKYGDEHLYIIDPFLNIEFNSIEVKNGAKCIIWDSKGERIALGCRDGTVRLWEVSSGRELKIYKGHGPINSLAWDEQNARLAAGGSDHTVRVWDVATGRELQCFSGHEEGISCVVWDPRSKQLISASYDNTVRIWEISTSRELRPYRQMLGGKKTVAWHQQVEFILTEYAYKKTKDWSDDSYLKTIQICDAVTGRELGHFPDLALWEFNNKRIAGVLKDEKTIKIWEADCGRELHCFGQDKSITGLAWEPTGKHLATSSEDGTVRVWDATNGRQLHCFSISTEQVSLKNILWGPKGGRLATISYGKSISTSSNTYYGNYHNKLQVWDTTDGRQLFSIEYTPSYCYGSDSWPVIWDPDGKQFALICKREKFGSDRTVVVIYDGLSGKESLSLESSLGSIADVFWQSTFRLIMREEYNVLTAWDTLVRKKLQEFRLEESESRKYIVSWNTNSPNSQCLALWLDLIKVEGTGPRDALREKGKSVHLWRVRDNKMLSLDGHTDYMTSVVWDAGGERIATGSLDKTVRIWNVEKGNCLAVIPVFDSVSSIDWYIKPSEDGYYSSYYDQEYLAVSFGSYIACFELNWTGYKEAAEVKAVLRWLQGPAGHLDLNNVNIEGARYLDSVNHELLKQRGARGEAVEVLERKSTPEQKHKLGHKLGQKDEKEEKQTEQSATVSKTFSPLSVKFDDAQSPDRDETFIAQLRHQLTRDLWPSLAQRAKKDTEFKTYLFSKIEESKKDESCAILAANAISILNLAGTNFSRMDLSGIHIPGADLSYAVLDSAILKNSDLRQVIFVGAWLRQVDFSNANMTGVEWGELPTVTDLEEVNTITYSADGRWLAIGCWGTKGGCTYLYDTLKRELRTLIGHQEDYPNLFIFDERGERLLSKDNSNNVHLLQVSTGKLEREIDSKEFVSEKSEILNAVVVAGFDEKGQALVLSSNQSTVCLWSIETGQKQQLEGHTQKVTCLALGLKGKYYASGSEDKTVRIWNAKGLMHIIEHTDPIKEIIFDPTGTYLVSKCKDSSDKLIRFWNVITKDLEHSIKYKEEYRSKIVFNSSGDHFGYVDRGIAQIWQIKPWKMERDLEINEGFSFRTIEFDSRSEKLASKDDGYVTIWDVKTGKVVRKLMEQSGSGNILCLAFDPKSTCLAVGALGSLHLWKMIPGNFIRPQEGHTHWVLSLSSDSKCENLVSVSADRTMQIREIATGKLKSVIEEKEGVINAAIDSEGKRIVALVNDSSYDAKVCLYQVDTGTIVMGWKLHPNKKNISKIIFDPKGKWLACISKGNVYLYHALTGQLEHTLKKHGEVNGIAFDSRGEQLAVLGKLRMHLWEVATAKKIKIFKNETDNLCGLDFEPRTGRYIATGGKDKMIRLWNVSTGAIERTLVSTEAIRCIAFDPDGERLASLHYDPDDRCSDAVRLWLVATGACLATIREFSGSVRSMIWQHTLHGSFLVTGGFDHAIRCWQVDKEKSDKEKVRVSLFWTSHQTALTATDACIDGVIGLDTTSHDLLKQRGAKGM